MRRPLLALLATLLLPACGIKGPLYLPTEEQKREMAEREAARKEAVKKRKEAEQAQPNP
jgi:predicted small lipoprotein YifL